MFAPPFFGDPDGSGSGGALAVSVAPASRSKTGPDAALTTGSVTAAPTGGTSPYTYAWQKLSGAAISIDSPNSATTAFSASGLTISEGTRTAYFNCVVTDDVAATTTTATVVVSIRRTSGLSVTAEDGYSEATDADHSFSGVKAYVENEDSGVEYLWTKQSGDNITVSGEYGREPVFQANGLVEGETRTAVYRVTVSDDSGATDYADINVTIEWLAPITFSPAAGTIKGQIVSLSSSRAVVWRYTKTGSSGGAASQKSGYTGTYITFSQQTTGSSTFTVEASEKGAVLAEWSLVLRDSEEL